MRYLNHTGKTFWDLTLINTDFADATFSQNDIHLAV